VANDRRPVRPTRVLPRPTPATGALVLAALACAASIGYGVQRLHLAAQTGRVPAAAPLPPAPAAATGTATDPAAIAGWHLFGTPGAAASAGTAAPETPEITAAPESTSGLVLTGVAAAGDRQRGRAIIATADGREHKYAVGDALPGDASLHAIEPRRVIIRRAGRYESLSLREEPGADSAGPRAADGAPGTPRARPPAALAGRPS